MFSISSTFTCSKHSGITRFFVLIFTFCYAFLSLGLPILTSESGRGFLENRVYAASGDSVSFVGIKKSRTAKILDDFKDSQKVILFDKSPFTQEEEQGMFESE